VTCAAPRIDDPTRLQRGIVVRVSGLASDNFVIRLGSGRDLIADLRNPVLEGPYIER
jgi:hypothetical protein